MKRLCPTCHRTFTATATPEGVPDHTYCGEPCRHRHNERRRRPIIGLAVECAVCGASFWRITARKVLCPPPWPEEYWDPSPCAEEWQRRTAKARKDRWAARQLKTALAAA